jgi:hypothetical protein
MGRRGEKHRFGVRVGQMMAGGILKIREDTKIMGMLAKK